MNSEVGVLPSSWNQVELSALAPIHYGKALGQSVRDDSGGVPVVGSSGIIGLHSAVVVDGPSLVIGRKGSAGSVYLLKESCWPIDTAYYLQAPSGVQLIYLYYFLKSQQLVQLDKSTAIPSLSRDDLYRVLIPIAPSLEQARIVDKLEELFTELDAGVAELQAARKKLVRYRQSLLKAAVEGALTAAWRERTGAPAESGAALLARILQERRARWEAKQLAKFASQGKAAPKGWRDKYPEPAQPDASDLPALPDGWTWATVEQIGDVQLGRQRSPDKLTGLNPVRYIRAANITEAGVNLDDVLEMDFSENEQRTFALMPGDVLLTEASGSPEHVGRPAVWRAAAGIYCFQNTVLRFSPIGVSSEYAFFSFLAKQKLGEFQQLSGGVGINHLSAGKFSKLALPLPPSTEQFELVSIIVEKNELLDVQMAAVAHSLKQAAAQRQNILRAAFAGRLLPQDPTDEPASVLLARIRGPQAGVKKTPRARKTKDLA